MPIPLLHPRLDLATLANMDDVPGIATDWLRDQYEREEPGVALADVALMFGQGFDFQKDCQRCDGDGKAHGSDRPFEWSPNRMKCPTCKGRSSWCLPKPTLETWLGCTVGAEARRAVEAWQLVHWPRSMRWVAAQWKEIIFSHEDQDTAARQLRRRVLGLPAFAGVRRYFDACVSQEEMSAGKLLSEVVGRHGLITDRWDWFHFTGENPIVKTLGAIKLSRYSVFSQNFTAPDFVPPEPETFPHWHGTNDPRPRQDIRRAVRESAERIIRDA